jgi:hypothetical protein
LSPGRPLGRRALPPSHSRVPTCPRRAGRSGSAADAAAGDEVSREPVHALARDGDLAGVRAIHPVMTLKIVVLPAPFGPMSHDPPRCADMDRSLTAVSPRTAW